MKRTHMSKEKRDKFMREGMKAAENCGDIPPPCRYTPFSIEAEYWWRGAQAILMLRQEGH